MEHSNELIINFDAYLRHSNPQVRNNMYAWCIGIGLQAVDGLHTSEYMQKTAIKAIEGNISPDEVRSMVTEYHEYKESKGELSKHKREADFAAINIARLLLSPAVPFSVEGFKSIHRGIFDNSIESAGHLRDYNTRKSEWILDGASVHYSECEDLEERLTHDIEEESRFSYDGLTKEEIVKHITDFTSRIWLTHAFVEGNTRTVATFVIQHLHDIGIELNPVSFARNSEYFRNALVRACYESHNRNIAPNPVYLERFFRNMIMGEMWVLKSRYLMLNPPEKYREQQLLQPLAKNRFDEYE